MPINKGVKKQWERLFDYYKDELVKQCKGATEEQIAKAESELGVKFPKSFADFFRVCDERFILKDKSRGFLGKSDIYPLCNTYYDGFNLIHINKEIRIYDESWKNEWIAFYDYETWFEGILDTKTEKIFLSSTEDIKPVLWANSFEEWFKMVVDEVLEYGELRLETIEKKLNII